MTTKIETILTGNAIQKFTRFQNNNPENEINKIREKMAAGQLNFRYPSVVCLFGYILSFMLGSGAGEPIQAKT